MLDVFLRGLNPRRHIRAKGQEFLGLMTSTRAFACDNIEDRLHGLVLIAVGGDLTPGQGLEHLLTDRAVVIFGQWVLTEDHRVAHIGVECAQDDGQGADDGWCGFLCEGPRQTWNKVS